MLSRSGVPPLVATTERTREIELELSHVPPSIHTPIRSAELVGNASDIGTEVPELQLNGFVAAIDVVDA